ncbi:DNA methyltransferase [Paramecium bursaria Chlorella virus NY2A]|uniref:Uncharacterized protein B013L n=1 Tax=Paramecium bursaria Chlorella virus NY2A TaxID=46021 RepID=A7IVN8_PBCVN|nr:DNA methyltransferase [Paramecium bursaria Chlorella virus NY2A]ABT14412.1 hypothetical protein NY2A_B013L [Paramecium bursaria Chlorella virus NY2A]
MNSKSKLGQFFTTNADYIFKDMIIPENVNIIEPFAGSMDLIRWAKTMGHSVGEMYDIEPRDECVVKRDTLLDPPDYHDKFVLTNPPYLARNKSVDKTVFDKYATNDLYKIFLYTITDCAGGLIIIPAGFFMSPRDLDIKCRNEFMSRFAIKRVNYFEERVFDDTSTTIVAILFERNEIHMTSQNVRWCIFPEMNVKTFDMRKEYGWMIGGDIYDIKGSSDIKIRRYVSGMSLKNDENISHLTLHALDSGSRDGRIKLVYDETPYEGKSTSRSYATLCFNISLTDDEQRKIANEFTRFIEEKRTEYHSLFLPMYRESKEYARKRIPFDLSYKIVSYIIDRLRS